MKRQLDLTHRQARRAARIVQNLLEFSRPASPQKKPIDANSIIELRVSPERLTRKIAAFVAECWGASVAPAGLAGR